MDYINELIANNELQLTTNMNEAITILPSGSMISGEFDCGVRGVEHNQLLGYNDNHQKLLDLGITIIIPESNKMVLPNGTIKEVSQC